MTAGLKSTAQIEVQIYINALALIRYSVRSNTLFIIAVTKVGTRTNFKCLYKYIKITMRGSLISKTSSLLVSCCRIRGIKRVLLEENNLLYFGSSNSTSYRAAPHDLVMFYSLHTTIFL